jgi:hypothetical protein
MPSASTSKKRIEEDDNDDIFLPEDDVHTDDGEHISAELRALMDKCVPLLAVACVLKFLSELTEYNAQEA